MLVYSRTDRVREYDSSKFEDLPLYYFYDFKERGAKENIRRSLTRQLVCKQHVNSKFHY